MPRLNGTGPNGEGSKTGRGLGDCNSNQENVKTNNEEQKNDNQSTNQVISKKPLLGRGLGLGRRNGRGFRNRGR
jgi:hypothetical protein